MCYNLHIIVNLIQFNNMKLFKPDTEKNMFIIISIISIFFITGFERGENFEEEEAIYDILNIWDNLNLFKKEIYLSILIQNMMIVTLIFYILHALFNFSLIQLIILENLFFLFH